MRGIVQCCALIAVALSIGCATAVVRKVPNRADYENWTDEDQRMADAMCGLRFYRSRPYVVVHDPFPVTSSAYLVEAVVNPDGQSIRIIGNCPRKLTDDLIHIGVGQDMCLPGEMLWDPEDAKGETRAAPKPKPVPTPAPTPSPTQPSTGNFRPQATGSVLVPLRAFRGSNGGPLVFPDGGSLYNTEKEADATAHGAIETVAGSLKKPVIRYRLTDFKSDDEVTLLKSDTSRTGLKVTPGNSAVASAGDGTRKFSGTGGSGAFKQGDVIVGSKSRARATIKGVSGDAGKQTVTYQLNPLPRGRIFSAGTACDIEETTPVTEWKITPTGATGNFAEEDVITGPGDNPAVGVVTDVTSGVVTYDLLTGSKNFKLNDDITSMRAGEAGPKAKSSTPLAAQGIAPGAGAGAGAGDSRTTGNDLITPGTKGDPPTVVAPVPNDTADPKDADVTAPTGQNEISLSTYNEVYQKKVTNSFDIIYLPDFEEEYVIDPKANLGSMDMRFTQGPGGVLMAMGMKVDNSAITRPIVDAWKDIAGALSRAGTTAVDKMVPSFKAQAGPDGKPKGPVLAQAGKRVTLRIHVVSMASQGMYPILKAKEVINNRQCMSQLQDCDCHICRGRTAREMAERQHVVPVYPYSRIAYQVHRVIIVEKLVPTRNVAPPFVNFKGQAAQNNKSDFRPQAAPSAPAAPAPVGTLTNQELLRKINGILASECTCNCAKILIRNPGVGDLKSIKTLRLLIQRSNGRPAPAVMAPYMRGLLLDRIEWAKDIDLQLVTTE